MVNKICTKQNWHECSGNVICIGTFMFLSYAKIEAHFCEHVYFNSTVRSLPWVQTNLIV